MTPASTTALQIPTRYRLNCCLNNDTTSLHESHVGKFRAFIPPERASPSPSAQSQRPPVPRLGLHHMRLPSPAHQFWAGFIVRGHRCCRVTASPERSRSRPLRRREAPSAVIPRASGDSDVPCHPVVLYVADRAREGASRRATCRSISRAHRARAPHHREQHYGTCREQGAVPSRPGRRRR